MPNELSVKSLLQTFAPATKQDWTTAASQETKSPDPTGELTWEGPDGINFFPYYDESDLQGLSSLKKFQSPPSPEKLHGARYWRNLPPVDAQADNANRKARTHLDHGANGILFEIEQASVNPAQLLEGIQWAPQHISFVFNDAAAPALIEYIINRHTAGPGSVTGSFFWKKISSLPERVLNAFLAPHNFFYLGLYIEKNTNAAEEIISALYEGVRLADTLTASGVPAEHAIRHIAFSIEAGSSFFHTIAKLKTLRMLWYQVARAYHINTYRYADVFIHTRCEAWVNKQYQPHGNMLRSTTSAMAAIIGGCDALTVYAEDRSNNVMERVARNVSNVLRDESHFDRVADPLAGAYFAEAEFAVFARHVWESFQKKIRQS